MRIKTNKLLKRADSPTKRIGLLLTLVSFPLLIFSAISWNLTQKGFVYLKTEKILIETPKPAATEENTFWKKSAFKDGWVLYDEQCVNNEENKDPNNPLNSIFLSPECEIKYIEPSYKTVKNLSISLFDYLAKMVAPKNTVGRIIVFSFVFGLVLYLGLLEKLYRFIMTGER